MGEAAPSAENSGAGKPAEASPAPAADGAYGSATLLGRLEDGALKESCGLVASRRNPGLLWTHNDAGDGANLYCVNR